VEQPKTFLQCKGVTCSCASSQQKRILRRTQTQQSLRSSHLAIPRASTLGLSSSTGASTSHAAPVGSSFLGAACWGDGEWDVLLDLPR
jgi:hypothetical protein